MWHKEKLEKQITFMEENDYEFTFTEYTIMKENGEITDKKITIPERIDYKGMLKNTIIGCLTVVLNIEKLGRVELPNIRTRQDMALWLSILKRGYIAYGLKEQLAYYRKVEGSISSNKFKAAKMNWKVYREVEKLSLLNSTWCFVHYAYNAVKKRKV
jgi:teichuronic acid biosynthesis glycosyltransferase TuaG